MRQDEVLDLVLKLIDESENRDHFFVACKHPKSNGKKHILNFFCMPMEARSAGLILLITNAAV